MTDTSFLDYVLEQLREVRALESRRMFGGHGLYLNGAFFGIVHRGTLYFRTDDETRAAFVRAGSRPFNPRGRVELHHYYAVPADVLEDSGTLCAWAKAAAKTRN